MTARPTIDDIGRVAIPQLLREQLDLAPGDTLELETSGEQITLRPVPKNAFMTQEKGVWVFRTGEPLSASAANAALQNLREERDQTNAGER